MNIHTIPSRVYSPLCSKCDYLKEWEVVRGKNSKEWGEVREEKIKEPIQTDIKFVDEDKSPYFCVAQRLLGKEEGREIMENCAEVLKLNWLYEIFRQSR